jgi:hypothetical protein
MAQDWLNLTLLDQDTIAKYSLSQDAVQMDTLLINNAGAATEAKRRLDFYKKQHIMYKFTGTAKLLGLKLGQSVTLVHSRFNLYNSNVHPYPRDISAWTGVGVGTTSTSSVSRSSTLSRDTTVTDSPAGGVPLKMVTNTTSTAYTRSYDFTKWNLAAAYSGEAWTVSVWVKADIATTGNIYIFGADSTGNAVTNTNGTFTIGTTWRKVSFTTTLTDGSSPALPTNYIQIRLGGQVAVGATIWWDGLQVEKKSGTGVVGAGVSGQVIALSPNWTTGHVDVEVLT